MSYTALYRKFRPSDFDEVRGQEHIVTTLKNQIQMDRVGHAYLFCGTRGTGKTTIAKILAKAVNCEHPVDGSPCGECEMCHKIQAGTSLNVTEIDAASNNGVANIRDIIDEVQYSPTEGRYKVYIIDEVHMLSTGAFNALLKTLEEPPSYVMFILATTEAHKIPITILSRCQRYDFKRITIDTIAARLRELVDREQVVAEEKALRYIARAADGSMRDALSLLDQCIAFYLGQELTYDRALEVLGAVDQSVYSRTFDYLMEQDAVSCLQLIDEMMTAGRDLPQFVQEFVWYLRNLLMIGASGAGADIVDAATEQLQIMQEQASRTDSATLIRYIRILSELSNQIRYAVQKRVMVEVTFVQLCRPQMDSPQDLSSLSARLAALEKKVEQGIAVDWSQMPAQAAGQPAGEPQAQEQPPVPQVLEKAVPEDVKAVIGQWPQILEACGGGFKQVLAGATKQVSERGGLLLLFTDPTDYRYFGTMDSKYTEQLKRVIAQLTGKDMEVEVRLVESQVAQATPDLEQLIHFGDIEYFD